MGYLLVFSIIQFNKCILNWLFEQFILSILTVYFEYFNSLLNLMVYNTFQSEGTFLIEHILHSETREHTNG